MSSLKKYDIQHLLRNLLSYSKFHRSSSSYMQTEGNEIKNVDIWTTGSCFVWLWLKDTCSLPLLWTYKVVTMFWYVRSPLNTSQVMWVPLIQKTEENICELITITVLMQAWRWRILSFCYCYLLYFPVLSFLRHSNQWCGPFSQFTFSWILKLNMQEKGSAPWLPCCLYSWTGTPYRIQQTAVLT